MEIMKQWRIKLNYKTLQMEFSVTSRVLTFQENKIGYICLPFLKL